MAARSRSGGGPHPARRRPAPPTPAAAIADWLTLVEPDGAFLTPSVLKEVFPHGFDPLPAERRTELRSRVADLAEDASARREFRRWLLADLLEWDDLLAEDQQVPAPLRITVAEHGVTLAPTLALLDGETATRTRLGVFVWPPGTALARKPDAAVTGDSWSASPVQRAEKWCREASVPLALVTDDDEWVLVWAPRGATTATCRWRITDVADERILQAGLVSLLGARRFFAVPTDPKTGETLERLFERSADAELEVTRGLGRSVRRSVELVVAAISREHVASGQRLLASVSDLEVYEAAVTVLMRLVFLLYAEERRLLPSEDPLWADSYSVLTLREQLREAAHRGGGEEALEGRSTAWYRLLATFRAVHGGVNHDRLRGLPGFGGALFDRDRFLFLEGRQPDGEGVPVAVDDRTVLAVLDSLLTVEVGKGTRKVAQRLSYKALDVEQIGHCYEGLLDHGCAPVEALSVGLIGAPTAEPELTLDELDARREAGDEALCEWLADKSRCNQSVTALRKALARQPAGLELASLREACGQDDDAAERIRPFWGLVRTDLRGLPVVFKPGAKYVTQTSTRRNTGAQYTTRELAEEVVRYALEPLVYAPGPAEESDAERWKLKPPHQILDLRVCDPAVGSGAILTAACRYLADRLVEAVTEHGPGEGRFATRLADLVAASPEDQVIMARREIADHCLYGVDKNPVAAEMAKLSLWLTTMARERPFTFLDHAIQVGDSLLGITDVEQLRWLHLDPSARQGQGGFELLAIEGRIKEAVDLARQLQSLSVVTLRDAAEKRRLHEQLRSRLADLSVVADAVVGGALSTCAKGVRSTFEDRLAGETDRIREALDPERTDDERAAVLGALSGIATGWLRTDMPDEAPMPWDRACLHWPLVFPEVFLEDGRSGFDAMVANPPFFGGKRISGANGVAYREHLVRRIAEGATGNADLVAYFLLRMCRLARSVGTLATNTISQGDTREVALDRLLVAGVVLHRAVKSEPWPNEATLEIAKVWTWSGEWQGARYLDGKTVATITASLDPARRVHGVPYQLATNAGKSFQGCVLATLGFILDPTEAQQLIEDDLANVAVVKPYLNGEDLNTHPTQTASRWVIDFGDRPEERARQFAAPWRILEERVKPVVLAKKGYPGWAERWWQFWRPRAELNESVHTLDRFLVLARVSRTIAPAFVNTGLVVSDACAVITYGDYVRFGIASCTYHWWWAITYASTMRTDLRYTPSDVFETFPQPEPQSGPLWDQIDLAGRNLNEFRADLMIRTNLGLTKTYNHVHDPDEHDPDYEKLRDLHVVLDHAVRDAYGWSDLPLNHHHWETPQGMRFTVSPEAKDELLDRLLELNHERYAAEVAAGLHDKKSKSKAKRSATSRKVLAPQSDDGQGSLL